MTADANLTELASNLTLFGGKFLLTQIIIENIADMVGDKEEKRRKI
jgi:hypothetical protein